MAIVLALPRLYDAVVARFALDGLTCPNLFGWRDPPQKYVTGNRICWIPGDDGDMGEIAGARYPGQNPRSLATLRELFTVEILASSADQALLENERAQYQAARELYDAWYRAVYLAAFGTFYVLRTEWMTDKKERRYGAGIRAVCSIEAMIPDAPVSDATDGETVTAEIATTVLDETETDTILPES